MVIRAIAVMLVGAALVGITQPRVDRTRIARSIDNALVFTPDGRQLEIASSGLSEPIADLLWVRAVLVFGERWDLTADRSWVTWMGRMLEAINTLDPRWRTPYFYGGVLMRVAGDGDGSDAVFARGMENLPEDPYFPFNLGMNAYLLRSDAKAAGEYLTKAAQMPKAPPWYAAAAAAMRQQHGERAGAIHFLKEILENTRSEAVRADTERQLRRLYHNEIVDRWEEACREYLRVNGHPLASAEQIRELGFELPENPRGDAWIVGTDGVVRSEGAERDRRRRDRLEEWKLAGP